MDAFQRNTVRSFRKAKEDMKNLQAQITDLGKRVEDLMEVVYELKGKKSTASRKR